GGPVSKTCSPRFPETLPDSPTPSSSLPRPCPPPIPTCGTPSSPEASPAARWPCVCLLPLARSLPESSWAELPLKAAPPLPRPLRAVLLKTFLLRTRKLWKNCCARLPDWRLPHWPRPLAAKFSFMSPLRPPPPGPRTPSSASKPATKPVHPSPWKFSSVQPSPPRSGRVSSPLRPRQHCRQHRRLPRSNHHLCLRPCLRPPPVTAGSWMLASTSNSASEPVACCCATCSRSVPESSSNSTTRSIRP